MFVDLGGQQGRNGDLICGKKISYLCLLWGRSDKDACEDEQFLKLWMTINEDALSFSMCKLTAQFWSPTVCLDSREAPWWVNSPLPVPKTIPLQGLLLSAEILDLQETSKERLGVRGHWGLWLAQVAGFSSRILNSGYQENTALVPALLLILFVLPWMNHFIPLRLRFPICKMGEAIKSNKSYECTGSSEELEWTRRSKPALLHIRRQNSNIGVVCVDVHVCACEKCPYF